MGWIYTHKSKSTSVKDFFKNEFDSQLASGAHGKVLDVKTKLRTAYIAYETTSPNGEVTVGAIVCMIDYDRKSYNNFGYKDMCETCHPYYYDCPKSILNLLTPTTDENANVWRGKCLAYIEAKKNAKVNLGDTLVFEREFNFGGFNKDNEFRCIDAKKLHFIGVNIGIAVRLTKDNLINNNYIVKGV